jgi:NTP pyrophosphatase (non-canonical NTP hydrolase)
MLPTEDELLAGYKREVERLTEEVRYLESQLAAAPAREPDAATPREALMTAIAAELDRAYAKHGREPWGRHEFYAILLEEVDELWDAIKGDEPQERVHAELRQVAAMCFRYFETGDRYRRAENEAASGGGENDAARSTATAGPAATPSPPAAEPDRPREGEPLFPPTTWPRFYHDDGRIFDRAWRSGYRVKVWAERSDGAGLTDRGPEVAAGADALVALLNAGAAADVAGGLRAAAEPRAWSPATHCPHGHPLCEACADRANKIGKAVPEVIETAAALDKLNHVGTAADAPDMVAVRRADVQALLDTLTLVQRDSQVVARLRAAAERAAEGPR